MRKYEHIKQCSFALLGAIVAWADKKNHDPLKPHIQPENAKKNYSKNAKNRISLSAIVSPEVQFVFAGLDKNDSKKNSFLIN